MQFSLIVTIQDNSNYGDDLLFLSGIRLLNLHFIKMHVRFYVKSNRLSKLAQEARLLIKTIPLVENISQSELGALNRDDYIIVHLGGTVFSSKYSVRSRLSHFIRDRYFSKNVICPDVYFSLGVDRNPCRKRYLRNSLAAAKYIAVRDYSSFVAISELVGRYDAFVIPDSVFSFPFDELLKDLPKEQSLFDHINITRYWPFDKIDRNNRFYRKEEKGCCNIGFCNTDKSDGQMVLIYDGTFNGIIQITKLLSSARSIVSERYHGIVAAMSLGVPVVGHCIDLKIHSLAIDVNAEELGDNCFLFPPDCSANREDVENMYLKFFELNELCKSKEALHCKASS